MRIPSIFLACLCLFVVGLPDVAEAIEARRLVVVEGEGNTPPEKTAVQMFTKRVLKRSEVTIKTLSETQASQAGAVNDFDLAVVVGQPTHNALAKAILERHGIRPPGGDYPGPEGFVLRAFPSGAGGVLGEVPTVVASGVDDRGTVYAVGRLLRESDYTGDSMDIPPLNVVDKPAFEYRGIGISHMDPRQAERTGASQEFDYNNFIEDLYLFGFNGFGRGWGSISVKELREEGFNMAHAAQSEQVDGWGLLYVIQSAPNSIRQEDWKDEFRGTERPTYACASVPEAREIMLEGREAFFKHAKRIDVLVLAAGDIAGCRCPKCEPWVETYVKLCEEIAVRLHKYHPDAKVWLTSQVLGFDESQWLWDFLNEEPRPWVAGISYAPSGDELTPYLTGRVNRGYERYLGMGRQTRYLQEVFRQTPRTMEVTSFPDISHWISSQYEQVTVPPEMVAMYERRTFNVRPRQFYEVFHKTAGFTTGTVAYCEGIFDDVNKVVWTQLHWNPGLGVEEILEDYFRWYCGSAAAPEMVEAALLLEENQGAVMADNGPGFKRYLSLVRSAGEKMPPRFREANWRYLMFLEKGMTDLYIHHKVKEGVRRLATVDELLGEAADSEQPGSILEEALDVLEADLETSEMAGLREEATRVDDELNAAAGYRFVALLNMVERDVVGLNWTAARLREALATADTAEMQRVAAEVAHYDDPGPGGHYDNCGHLGQQPHHRTGQSSYWRSSVADDARPSQAIFTYNYPTAEGANDGVSYQYDELDQDAQYRVKLTFALSSRGRRSREITQRVLADGQAISDDVALAGGDVKQVEYGVPRSATADGHLTLEIVAASPEAYAVVSEIWLMKE